MPEQKPLISVLLADDHPLMRKGLKEMIEEDSAFHVVEEANNGASALELIEQLRPALAVLDIDMPKMNGLMVAEAVKAKKLSTRIVMLTMYDKENILAKAMEIGVLGYVLKDSAASEILEALKSAAEGRHYITPALSGHLVRRAAAKDSDIHTDEQQHLSRLTATERKIVQMIAQDRSSKEIAEILFISPRTVDTHRNNICQKLNLRGANALYKFAAENRHVL